MWFKSYVVLFRPKNGYYGDDGKDRDNCMAMLPKTFESDSAALDYVMGGTAEDYGSAAWYESNRFGDYVMSLVAWEPAYSLSRDSLRERKAEQEYAAGREERRKQYEELKKEFEPEDCAM